MVILSLGITIDQKYVRYIQKIKGGWDKNMEQNTLYIICSIIILIASTLTAACTIYSFFKKPVQQHRERQETDLKKTIVSTLKEVLPELLKAHDLEVRAKYKADRERYLHEIKTEVLNDTEEKLDQVKILGIQYETLAISARDVLREKIIKIYLANKETKQLTFLEREKLDQFYKDYKALNGNSYIDKYYRRMSTWSITDDDYDDDDII